MARAIVNRLNQAETRTVRDLVDYYEQNKKLISVFHTSLLAAITEWTALASQVHTVRDRMKSPESLQDKLTRKHLKLKAEGKRFSITKKNLFTKINDLSGIRLLHLHSQQFGPINEQLMELVPQTGARIIQGPIAKVWDDETRSLFRSLNVKTEESSEMYTSVHYVLESYSQVKVTSEIQVRTLMEEVWGEVSHSLSYPHPNISFACKEQIRTLARFTSGVSRLVDAIFATDRDSKLEG